MAIPNLKLRALRESTPSRMFVGYCLSRAEVADHVCRYMAVRGRECPVDRKYIQKLERGLIRWPNEHYRGALRDLFGVDDVALGFRDTSNARHRQPVADANEVDLTGLPWTGPGTEVGAQRLIGEEITVDLNRRKFAQLSAATLVGLAVDGRITHAKPANARASGRRIGGSDIEALTTERMALARMDDSVGSGVILDNARFHLAKVSAVLTSGSYSETIARDLHTTLGEAARLLGWLLWDQADYPAARHHFLAAFHAARSAVNQNLYVHVASFAAAMEAEAGNTAEAVRLAGVAINAPCRSAGLRGLAYFLHAECAGADGQLNLARRSLDKAEAACQRSDRSDLPTSLYWWDEPHRHEHRGRVNGLIGNHDLAHHELGRCISLTGRGQEREQLRAVVKQAEAMTKDPAPGACDEAASLGRAAVTLLGGIQSPRNVAAVRRLSDSLAPYDTAEVRKFREQARDVA